MPMLPRRGLLLSSAAAGAAALLPVPDAQAQQSAIPRNRTLILIKNGAVDGRWVDYELWNAYAIGSNHQNGPNLIYEPLAYYSAFADKMYHVAGGELSVHPRFQATDDQDSPGHQLERRPPFSAEDVAYTFNTLRDLGPKVKWGVDVQQSLDRGDCHRTRIPWC